MWRMTDERKVWYEWMCEVYAIVGGEASGTANGRVRKIKVGGTELHSSEKEACLM